MNIHKIGIQQDSELDSRRTRNFIMMSYYRGVVLGVIKAVRQGSWVSQISGGSVGIYFDDSVMRRLIEILYKLRFVNISNYIK
jgi:hypothetical protein